MTSPAAVTTSATSLSELLAQGAVWRGEGIARLPGRVIASGEVQLDAELPGGGWPCGQLTEILLARHGIGEMSLLLPALAEISAAGGWLALVDPPWAVHAPAWAAAGIVLERVVLVRAQPNAAWATEQLLVSGGFAAVLAWSGAQVKNTFDVKVLRRLQLAVEGKEVFAVVWRSTACAAQASPAPLRIALDAVGEDELQLRILKRRGCPAGRPLRLQQPGRNPRALAGPALSLIAARSAGATLCA